MLLHIINKIIQKLIIGPIKYGRKNDYKAEQYWKDRFMRHGFHSLTSTGHEGLSHKENKKYYTKARKDFISLLNKYVKHIQDKNILEIGVGNGFYTNIFFDLKAKSYHGTDITDVFFNDLKNTYPRFKFSQLDITTQAQSKKYDLIVMIDVIEHIVNKDRLVKSIHNIFSMLKKDGIFIISGFYNKSQTKKNFFYQMSWDYKDLKPLLNKYTFLSEPIPFRYDNIIFLQKKSH